MFHSDLILSSLSLSPPLCQFLIFMISILGGAIGAILGLGGGVIVVPALTVLFGINIRYAIGASIVSVIATSSGAAATYVRDHITNIRVAMLLEVATSIGALSGAMLAPFIPRQALFVLFSFIIFYSGFVMMRPRAQSVGDTGALKTGDVWGNKLRLNSSYPDQALGKEVVYAVAGVPKGFLLMLGAGLISGLLGIGSGVLKVPAMDRVMRLPIKVSSATSNFMIGVTGAASAGAYYMRGDILPWIAAPVALGVFVGSLIGTRLMVRLPSAQLRKIFLIVLAVIGVQMLIKAVQGG